MNTHVWSFLSWEVIPRDGKFYCEQGFSEAMRLDAEGSVNIGGGRTVLKSYEFLTREWAELCQHRMIKMDMAFDPPPLLRFSTLSRLDIGGNSVKFHFNSGAKEVIRISPQGGIEHVDLPFLMWVWLRNSALARGLKRLWYGERGQA